MIKSYASYFVSYLLNNLKDLDNIERIILFGSVAKEEATKESDVDLFIEIKKETVKFKEEIKKIENKFYQSREALIFKTNEIENKFNIKIGLLKEWKDLYKSIASTGIILYEPYEAKELPSEVKHNIIIYWDKIEKNRGSFLNKLYGFKIKKKTYKGLIAKFNGKKIGKSSIMIPVIYKKDILKLIKEHKVSAKTIEVFV